MNLKSFVRNYALTCYTFTGDPEDYFVARLILKYMRGERVLDLGCGPVVPVTSVFYPNAREVVAVDRLKANLNYVKNNAPELDGIIKRARLFRKKISSSRITTPKIKLVQGDVTNKLALGKFEAVMNIGCFGALKNATQFQQAVDNAYSYLKPGGSLLMVNWIGQAKRPHKFNGEVDILKVFRPSLEKSGFKIKEIHKTSKILSEETKKLGYNQIIWAVAKK